MHPVLSLILGLVCAGFGGELFVRGAVGLASWARIPAGIIGATVAAFATSSPELSVSISSASAGAPQIALGDALGSNVANIGLILGIALTIAPLMGSIAEMKRDLPIALLAPVLTGVLVLDGELSRADGLILLAMFLAWLVASVIAARKSRDATPEVLGETKPKIALLEAIGGLVLLVLAGQFIVVGAKFIGGQLGWSEFVVGATLVAFGTSTPELATTLISRIKGEDSVGIGTVIGSNIFNGLFIVSVASLIHPIVVAPQSVMLGLGFGILTVALVVPGASGELKRWRGPILLLCYAGYVGFLIATGQNSQ